MSFSIGGIPRIPIFAGTAAGMAGMVGMIAGDLFYTTDTKINYVYSGTAWTQIAVPTNFTLIQNINSAGGQANIDFTSIANSYKYLMLTFNTKGYTGAGTYNIVINNDTTAGHYAYRTIKATTFTNTASASNLYISGTLGTGDNCAGFILMPQNIAVGTYHEITGSVSSSDNNACDTLQCGLYNVAAAINEIKMTFSGGNIGGDFNLYGLT